MGKPSRDKGRVAEQEVVNIFKAAGMPCRRRWEEQSKPGGQKNGDLDVEGMDIYTEVRRRETLSIPAWTKECREKSGDRDWALVFRRSNEPWSVAISLYRYLELLSLAEQDTDA